MIRSVAIPSSRALLLGSAILLGAMQPLLAAAPERAVAAAARGDLRAAQIEWRNAVRENPDSASHRAALAAASLDVGDGETAQREARAALDRGFDPSAGTALLMRSFLVNGRFEELLRNVPQPENTGPAAGQIAAGRAFAFLGTNQIEAARDAVETARRLAPDAVEPNLAASALAEATGDRDGAEAAVDRALARSPASTEALLRKATLRFERTDVRGAVQILDRVLATAPGNVPGRLRRAEALLTLDENDRARADLDIALATTPRSGPGNYLRASLLARSSDWAGMDVALQRVGPALGTFRDGFLLLALAKRGLGQTAQSEDAIRRHVGRWPADPRGARVLAAFELEANRPAEAIAALSIVADRGTADVEALDLLGRLQAMAGRPREAAAALQRAAELRPSDAAIVNRLAAARLAAGDVGGTTNAASEALRLDPQRAGARQMLAFAALYRGDIAAANTELDRLDPTARGAEPARILQGTIHLMRMELPQARSVYAGVLHDHPNSVAARVALARVSRIEGRNEDAERYLGEALRAEPGNVEALAQLATDAAPGAPRATTSRAILEAVQAASPADPRLAMTTANVLVRAGEAAKAAQLLGAEPLRVPGGVPLLLARAEAHAAAGEWAEAEAISRRAFAEAPEVPAVRRQLAGFLVRSGDQRGAETLIQGGLREQPSDPSLQQTLAALIQQARGLDAALAFADRIAVQPSAQPAGRVLRGDLLAAAGRPADAARAYGAVMADSPSAPLVRRHAAALVAAGNPADAAAALRQWLDREPGDDDARLMLSQLDLEAGRTAQAERNLEAIVTRRPADAVALNNLAWILGQKDEVAATARGRALAERAYFVAPTPDTADTLGWLLARDGQPGPAIALLRESLAARRAGATGKPDPAAAYRLAYALRASGARDEALTLLTSALDGAPAFPERTEAERLLADLRARR